MGAAVSNDEELLTLTEFIDYWKGGRFRIPGKRGRGARVVPFHPHYAKMIRGIIRQVHHYRLAGGDEKLEGAIKTFLRQTPRMALKYWKALLLRVKIEETPAAGGAIEITSERAMHEAVEAYVSSAVSSSAV